MEETLDGLEARAAVGAVGVAPDQQAPPQEVTADQASDVAQCCRGTRPQAE